MIAKYKTTSELKILGWTPTQIKLLKADRLNNRWKTIPKGYFYGGDGFKSQMYETQFNLDLIDEVAASKRWVELKQKNDKRLAKKQGGGKNEL